MLKSLSKLVTQGCQVFIVATVCLLGCGGQQSTGTTTKENNAKNAQKPVSAEALEEVKAFFDRKRLAAGRCFVSAWEKDPKGMGEKSSVYVTVTLRILPQGRIKNARVAESSAQSEMLNRCIIDLVNKWTFPQFESAFDYSYSFSFERF